MSENIPAQEEPQGDLVNDPNLPQPTDTAPNETDNSPGAETPPPESESKPTAKPWYHRRIAEEAERRRQAEAELARLRQQVPQNQEAAPAQPNIDQLVEQRAAEIARQTAMQQAAQATYNAGKAEFTNYDDAVQTLSDAFGEKVQTQQFYDAVFSLPNAAAVIHKLGTNLDTANDILSASPIQMAMKLERLAGTLAAAPKPARGNALTPNSPPPPVRPVGASSGTAKKQENWSAADWDEYYRAKRQGR